MKKALLIVLAAVVVVGAGVLSVRHYRSYKNQQILKSQQTANVEAQKQAQEQQAQIARESELRGKIQRLVVECQKGKAIYDTLPAYTKAKVKAPTCL